MSKTIELSNFATKDISNLKSGDIFLHPINNRLYMCLHFPAQLRPNFRSEAIFDISWLYPKKIGVIEDLHVKNASIIMKIYWKCKIIVCQKNEYNPRQYEKNILHLIEEHYIHSDIVVDM